MKKYLEKAMTFAEYIKLIDSLLAEGKTTGTNQSEAMYNYGKLNRKRMHRLEKTIFLQESTKQKLGEIRRKMIWLVITEGWCGDAAQNIPIIEKMAAASEIIETRYVLRDENPELMGQFLTNGTRSIPKLIVFDVESLDVIGSWGPRPNVAQNYFLSMKSEGLEKTVVMENLQRWYIEDKGRSIQREFEGLIDEWESKVPVSDIERAAWQANGR